MPGTYLADVFAQPVDVLTPHRGVDIRCTIDAAGAPNAPVRITAELSGPARGGGIRSIASTACTLDQVRAGQTAAALALTRIGRHLPVVPGQPGAVHADDDRVGTGTRARIRCGSGSASGRRRSARTDSS